MFIPPNELEMPESERQNIRNAFRLGFEFARIGYLSRGIK